MAAKEEYDMKNRLASISQASSCKSEEAHNEEESKKEKVAKLVSKIGNFFRKGRPGDLSSPLFFGMSPKMETHEMSPKTSELLPKHEKLSSPKLPELSLKIKQLPQLANECSNIDLLSPCLDEVSPDIVKASSPAVQQLSPTISKVYGKKRRNVFPEIFVFPTVPEECPVVETRQVTSREITSKPRRFQSEVERCRYKNIEDHHRPRFASEPCINKYSKLIASRGIKLTEAAYQLTEEQCRLLYEDIFKPLDVYSILQERRKTVQQEK